ncbi:hypothetical protein [Acidianus manzaensis]|uniref:Uncharacterized protein n=1 Tax=Acidianus manzaensis TaxID=282676 RepID=A0A1W6K2U5_9CREN|nr:hypothetical protein [Acidianus manzaensis]ARM76820.1 hypothetical protein B6F84_12855 [Acidianus manzaensis]
MKNIKNTKGLSEIIGFLILLIIVLAVLIPLGVYMFSQPTVEAQQAENANSYKDLATEQFRDFEPTELSAAGVSVSPVYFIYSNGSAYFVFVNNQNPPVNLEIRYFEVFKGATWTTIDHPITVSLSNAKSTFDGYPAIQIPVGNVAEASDVAAVTQFGNIIYASSPYVLPNTKLPQPVGIGEIDPYNFSVIEEPEFKIICETGDGIPILQFIHDVNGQNSNTMVFTWAYLGSSSSGSFSYDGYWYGPIAYTTPQQSGYLTTLPYPIFKGEMNGVFVGGNLTLSGSFTGSIGSNQGYPIYFEKGTASSITFNNSFIIGSIYGNFSGEICIPSNILNNYFISSASGLNITFSGEGHDIKIENLNGSLEINGNVTGVVNGKSINDKGKTTTISGDIDSLIINGTIKSGQLYSLYSSSYGYENGYIQGNIDNLELTSSGMYGILGNLAVSPLISGTFSNASLTQVIATSVPTSLLSFFPAPFNTTINDFSGMLTLSDNHGYGTFDGIINFSKPGGILSLATYGFQTFSGSINGEFEGGYWYELGAWVSPVTLSVNPSEVTDGSIFPAYSIPSLSGNQNYYYVTTPLVVKVQLEIGNPSNQTLEFNAVQISMKADEVYQFGLLGPNGPSGSQPVEATLYGSAQNNLNNPIEVPPLSVKQYTLTLSIPVNSIFAPGVFPPTPSQQEEYSSIESFTVDYIELYMTLLEPNGYGMTVTTLIPPYTIPVNGQAS